MTGLNNQSYLFECHNHLPRNRININFKTENKENVVRFEVIRRPTNDETNKDKDTNKQKSSVGHIILTSSNLLNLGLCLDNLVEPISSKCPID